MALPGAVTCLKALRAAGKRIVILSNSGRGGDANAIAMTRFGIERELYDAVVTAGDDARAAFHSRADAFHRRLGRRAMVIARDGELELAADFGVTPVDQVDAADFVLVLSLDSPSRAVADYETVLQAAVAAGLPMVCANPDITRVTPGAILEAPGAIARRYEQLGGVVRYHGKPDPGIYTVALDVLARFGVPPTRVIAVGDSIDHDVRGARGAGLPSVLVAGGIHREILGLVPGGHTDPQRWDALVARAGVAPEFLMASFVW